MLSRSWHCNMPIAFIIPIEETRSPTTNDHASITSAELNGATDIEEVHSALISCYDISLFKGLVAGLPLICIRRSTRV
jgi:hypothetical protein